MIITQQGTMNTKITLTPTETLELIRQLCDALVSERKGNATAFNSAACHRILLQYSRDKQQDFPSSLTIYVRVPE